ncbi:MAG: TetR/AcrR family transcriptional regulator [Gemmatimonadota bacterium]|nr:MAG: TetR/AcrR family transcriptional regulator [Gemmatimonadota bacterium]
MNEVIRMYENPTADALLRAARTLFARLGYHGASVRAIAQEAGANLGAITYHFGTKGNLYDAVIGRVLAPSRERLAAAAALPAPPLDRVEAVVRAFFAFLAENPDLPQFIMQQLMGSRPMPEAARQTLQANLGLLAGLISEGQSDGSVRRGDAQMMALSIVAQPVYLTVAQPILREVLVVDQGEPEARSRLVESVVSFVRAALSADSERD